MEKESMDNQASTTQITASSQSQTSMSSHISDHIGDLISLLSALAGMSALVAYFYHVGIALSAGYPTRLITPAPIDLIEPAILLIAAAPWIFIRFSCIRRASITLQKASPQILSDKVGSLTIVAYAVFLFLPILSLTCIITDEHLPLLVSACCGLVFSLGGLFWLSKKRPNKGVVITLLSLLVAASAITLLTIAAYISANHTLSVEGTERLPWVALFALCILSVLLVVFGALSTRFICDQNVFAASALLSVELMRAVGEAFILVMFAVFPYSLAQSLGYTGSATIPFLITMMIGMMLNIVLSRLISGRNDLSTARSTFEEWHHRLLRINRIALILYAVFIIAAGATLCGWHLGGDLGPKMIVHQIPEGSIYPDRNRPLEVVDMYGGERAVVKLLCNKKQETPDTGSSCEGTSNQFQVINLTDGFVITEIQPAP
ncbi:hypothetical protein K6V98_05580 [Collinsella sp. AGMB00827]|uniref:Uncharacterized protein n=1 Tax=Collinsella ureilytica TaxID=2869515 RepID=A0ABS7MKK4_9ACTN|nr:hypothetical protein [Collinsella urealyticum]MBY4797822.1 hypothetical protein [Collinsella urealyticum]